MSYNLLNPVHVITAGSMATTLTSAVVETKLQDNIGVECIWTTSTAMGTFSVQVSMDYAKDIEGNVTNSGHWVTLPISPSVTSAGVSDVAYIDLNQLSAPYVRVVYTASSGTGTLDVYINGKGV